MAETRAGVDSAARQENRSDINRLEEENASLRAYLDRVLVLLDTELPEPGEPQSAPAPTASAPVVEPAPPEPARPVAPSESGPSRLLRLADIERRVKRTEETLEDLVWLVTRLEHDATSKLRT